MTFHGMISKMMIFERYLNNQNPKLHNISNINEISFLNLRKYAFITIDITQNQNIC